MSGRAHPGRQADGERQEPDDEEERRGPPQGARRERRRGRGDERCDESVKEAHGENLAWE